MNLVTRVEDYLLTKVQEYITGCDIAKDYKYIKNIIGKNYMNDFSAITRSILRVSFDIKLLSLLEKILNDTTGNLGRDILILGGLGVIDYCLKKEAKQDLLHQY